jgi:hypothetical protein
MQSSGESGERADPQTMLAFIGIIGERVWADRMANLSRTIALGQYSGRALARQHAIELTLDRLRRGLNRPPSTAERCLLTLAGETAAMYQTLTADGRKRLRAELRAALSDGNTLVPMFHLIRTAMLQRSRGFAVSFAGLNDGAAYDLLLTRGGMQAEVACDVASAEDGRDVHRGAWVRLVDRVDPDLQTWLAAHPGRYLLKLTLPQGLRREPADQDRLAALHTRIRDMLSAQRRADHDEAAVLRLDPLMLAAAQASELGLMNSLREQFGHEAHLAVTSAGRGVFVMAARSGRENEVAAAMRRRMAALAPVRLTGERPGILALFVEDTDRAEWRHLRDRLELEGEARQFLTQPGARRVVAVTCASRQELFGAIAPDGASDGELRFRNPSHPAAKAAALAPAVLSSV